MYVMDNRTEERPVCGPTDPISSVNVADIIKETVEIQDEIFNKAISILTFVKGKDAKANDQSDLPSPECMIQAASMMRTRAGMIRFAIYEIAESLGLCG